MAAATKQAKPPTTLPLANANTATAKAITMAGTRFHHDRLWFTTRALIKLPRARRGQPGRGSFVRCGGGYMCLDASNDRRRGTILGTLESGVVALLRDRDRRRDCGADHGSRQLCEQRVPADLPTATAVLEQTRQRPVKERLATWARTARGALSHGYLPA
jgi:hypothetical protein